MCGVRARAVAQASSRLARPAARATRGTCWCRPTTAPPDAPLAAQVEAALGARARVAASRATPTSRSRTTRPTRCGRCARTSAKRSAAKAPTSSTTSRCRCRRFPRSSTRPRRALRAAFPGVRFVMFGHLGDGNLHYNLAAPEGGDAAGVHGATRRAPTASSTTSSRRHGGSISAEHGIGQLKRDELVPLQERRRDRADARDQGGARSRRAS